MVIKFLLFAIVAIEVLSEQSKPISQLCASSIVLQRSTRAIKQITYDVTLNNTTLWSPYQVAIGISYISNYLAPKSFDFCVRSLNKQAVFTIIFMINPQANWSTVHIHYLATCRQDIRAGNFAADNPELLYLSSKNNNNSNTFMVSHFFGERKWNGGSSFVVAYAYLAGLTCNDKYLQINIQQVDVSIASSMIIVSLNFSSKDPIKALYISYIMFTDIGSPVVVFSLIDPIKLQQTILLNHSSNHWFIGIMSINAKETSMSTQPINNNFNKINQMLLSTLSSKNLFSFTNYFQLKGVAIYSKQDFHGPFINKLQNTVRISVNYSECIQLGADFLNLNGTMTCVLCRPNSFFNYITKMCDCKDGYFLNKNQTCSSYLSICNPNQIYINGSCYLKMSIKVNNPPIITNITCKQNFIYNVAAQECICPHGYNLYFNKNNQTGCSQPCTDNLQFDARQAKCICYSGQYKDGICINCHDKFAKWNPISNKCQCINGTANLLEGPCQICSPYSIYNETLKTCKCIKGFVGSGVICRIAPSSSENYTIDFSNFST